MSKRSRLYEIAKCCELQFDHGNSTSWKQTDFLLLSREIYHATGVNISLNTLKRIFGKITVDEDYVPQQATLDALKKYGKYDETGSLQITPATEEQNTENLIPIDLVSITPREKVVSNHFLRVACLSFAALLVISVLMWLIQGPDRRQGSIQFVRTEGQLPATAYFEMKVPESDDSLFVNFGDKSVLQYVKAGKKTAAHIYFLPGVFSVSIQTRTRMLANTSVYIPSNEWIGLAFHNQQEIPNKFFMYPARRSGEDSLFQIENAQLSKMGLDTTGVILTRFCNYTSSDQSADEFVFEAKFRNMIPEKANYCRGTQFQISGNSGVIRFKLVSAGCSLRVLNVVSEKTFSGSTEDLSAFVVDLQNWNTIKIVNKRKNVSVFVNQDLIFSDVYQQTLGKARGVFVEFEGTGLIQNCNLTSGSGVTIYNF